MEVTFVRIQDKSETWKTDQMLDIFNRHLESSLDTAIKIVNFEHLAPAEIQQKLLQFIVDSVCKQNADALAKTTQMLAKIKAMGRRVSQRAKTNLATRDRVRNDTSVALVDSVIEVVMTCLSDPAFAHDARLQELGCLFIGKVAKSTKFRESVNGGLMMATSDRMGAVELVLRSWRIHGATFSSACAHCLSLLARGATISQHISAHDIDFILTELQQSTDSETCASSILVVALFAIEDTLRSKMRALSVVETILGAMRRFEDHARVQWTACQALYKMSLPEMSATKRCRRRLGLPESTTVADPMSPGQVDSNLREIMMSKGCASIIARAMRQHIENVQVQEHGQSALEALPDTEGLRAVLIVEAQKHRSNQGDRSIASASDVHLHQTFASPSRSSLSTAEEDALRDAREAIYKANSLSPISPTPQSLHHYHHSQKILESRRQDRVSEVCGKAAFG